MKTSEVSGEIPLPEGFEARLRSQYPRDWDTIKNALNSAPETSVLINSLKDSGKFAALPAVPWCEEGKVLPERILFAADPLWHAGTYYVQEAASMFLSRALDAGLTGRNIRALDLCAAPGGKSHVIQNFLKEQGALVSNEIIASRAAVLNSNIQRFGHGNTLVISADPASLANSGPLFDLVLCDAPCSGEGMFRKDHGARGEWNTGLPAFCAARQEGILQSASKLVKEGGLLIYSTCTLAQEENEDQLYKLWEEGGWESIRIPVASNWGVDEVIRNGVASYRLVPGLTPAGEGFFIGVLRKTERPSETKRKTGEKLLLPARNLSQERWNTWLRSGEEIQQDAKGGLWQVNSALRDILQSLSGSYKFLQAGTPLGAMLGKEFVPAHGLATALALGEAVPSVDLDLEKARVYLRGGDPGRELFSRNGWCLVRYQGFGIGWVKVLDRRVNNYYPKALRLLHH